MAVPASLRLELLRFAASTKAVRTLSSPPQGLHRDDEMCLFCEQTQMESSLITRRQLGALQLWRGTRTTLVVRMSDIRGKLSESEYYHSVLASFDKERDGLEFSPNKTQAVKPCPSAKVMPHHGRVPCFSPVSHQRPKASPAVSPELDGSRRCAQKTARVPIDSRSDPLQNLLDTRVA
jgi:hypothetical protein